MEPGNCSPYSLAQSRLRLKPEQLFRLPGIQTSARLAIGFAGVPQKLALEAYLVGDQMCQVLNRDFFARPDVHRLVAIVMLGR